MSGYKQAISITVDDECMVWLNNRKEKRSRVVNRLIQSAMAGEGDQIKDLKEQLAQAKKAIKHYLDEPHRQKAVKPKGCPYCNIEGRSNCGCFSLQEVKE